MVKTHWNLTLYAVNFTLLIVHEIDSAYWQEWNLFGIPGGIQVFALLHIPLILLGMLGYRNLLLDRRSGLIYALVIAAAGLVAFLLHTAFILTGHSEFRLPVSLGLLGVILLVSALQTGFAFRALRSRKTALLPTQP